MPGIRTDDIVFIRALAKENLNMAQKKGKGKHRIRPM